MKKARTILINKIETHPKLGKIFHISVSGVKVKKPRIADGLSTDLSHFPVSEEALKKSFTKINGQIKPNSDCLDGCQTLKSAFDKGEAVIFTIDVADIVGLVEQAIANP